MSLVAYDASSDEDDEAGEPLAAAAAPSSSIGPQPKPPSPSPLPSDVAGSAPPPQLPALPPAPTQNIVPTSSSNVSLPTPSLDLPDVATLFASPSLPSQQSRASDHSSRVSAATVGDASRKRESNGSALQDPRSKFPRVQVAQPHGAMHVAGTVLVPPQLSGRSNVVTEDISKLFVARRKE